MGAPSRVAVVRAAESPALAAWLHDPLRVPVPGVDPVVRIRRSSVAEVAAGIVVARLHRNDRGLDAVEPGPDGEPLRRHRLVALRARLAAVLPALAPDVDEPRTTTAAILDTLIRRCRASDADRDLWLLAGAVTATLPAADDLRALRRRLVLGDEDTARRAFLAWAGSVLDAVDSWDRGVDVVSAQPVAFVDGVLEDAAPDDARTDLAARVVRAVVGREAGTEPDDGNVLPLAWNAGRTALRRADGADAARLGLSRTDLGPTTREVDPERRIALPWRTAVLFPESPRPRGGTTTEPSAAATELERLGALAASSGNRAVVVGHDLVDVVEGSATTRDAALATARSLAVVKAATLVLAVSVTAGEVFGGWVDALPAQGRTGPEVAVVAVPMGGGSVDGRDAPAPVRDADATGPARVAVAAPAAAVETVVELLAARGITVDLVPFDSEQGRLQDADLALVVPTDDRFPLAVVDALDAGLPVVTSDRGTAAELAAAGGVVTADGTAVAALTDAVARALDPDVHRTLVAAVAARRITTWDEYGAAVRRRLVDEGRRA